MSDPITDRPFFTFSFLLVPSSRQAGFSLVEVMVAMIILAVGILGVMGSFQWADQGLLHGVNGMRALAMAESRLEAKRVMRWGGLLTDDVDGDGFAEITMRDDGTRGDERAGDGTYTASLDQENIHMAWTVQPDRPGILHDVGSVVIKARARYQVGPGQWREIEIGTLRANPNYIGMR